MRLKIERIEFIKEDITFCIELQNLKEKEEIVIN